MEETPNCRAIPPQTPASTRSLDFCIFIDLSFSSILKRLLIYRIDRHTRIVIAKPLEQFFDCSPVLYTAATDEDFDFGFAIGLDLPTLARHHGGYHQIPGTVVPQGEVDSVCVQAIEKAEDLGQGAHDNLSSRPGRRLGTFPPSATD